MPLTSYVLLGKLPNFSIQKVWMTTDIPDWVIKG